MCAKRNMKKTSIKKYKRYLNKKDPIDKKIMELVKNKELTIGITKFKNKELKSVKTAQDTIK